MYEAIIKIRKSIAEVGEVMDAVVCGVVNGHACPVCGSVKGPAKGGVESVVVKLEHPKRCGGCFIAPTCEGELSDVNCIRFWNDIIDNYKNN